MNRPDVLNAFGKTMHKEIIDAFRFAAADADCDVVVLTGAGRAYSAGSDLARMEECIADPDVPDREAADHRRASLSLSARLHPGAHARIPLYAGATTRATCPSSRPWASLPVRSM